MICSGYREKSMLHLPTKKQENQIQWDVQLFFLITFCWFWWFLEILLKTSLFVSLFSPFVGAFLLAGLGEGKEGVISFLKKGVSCNFPKGYWIPIFFLFPAISAIAFLIGTVLSESFLPLILLIAAAIFVVKISLIRKIVDRYCYPWTTMIQSFHGIVIGSFRGKKRSLCTSLISPLISYHAAEFAHLLGFLHRYLDDQLDR